MKLTEELNHLKEKKSLIILKLFSRKSFTFENGSSQAVSINKNILQEVLFYRILYGAIELQDSCLLIGGIGYVYSKRMTFRRFMKKIWPERGRCRLVKKDYIKHLGNPNETIELSEKEINELVNIISLINQKEKIYEKKF